MGTLTGFSTSIGFVIASAIGLPQCFGRDDVWHWSFALEIIPTIILMISLHGFLPKSPIRSLKKGDEKEALNSLTFFQNKEAAMSQLSEFQREIRNERFEDRRDVGCIGLMKNSKNALIICLLLNSTVSFSGIISVSFFGTLLLQNIGFSDNAASLANCIASFCGIAGNILGSFAIDKVSKYTGW
jgi:predicted MFS family arabinose efflux permease